VTTLGECIQRERKRLGWTEQTLAERAGVTQVYVSFLEAGEIHNPAIGPIVDLARALEMRPHDLFELAVEGLDLSRERGLQKSGRGAYHRSTRP
jgi:transcriptional regulator with XRE-family HTH domain